MATKAIHMTTADNRRIKSLLDVHCQLVVWHNTNIQANVQQHIADTHDFHSL